MTALESLAAGCPIVATSVDGTPEVVLHEKTGLLVPPSDPDALALAIRKMLRDPVRAQSMAAAGREFVLENFTVEKLLQRTQQFYLRAWEERIGSSLVGAPKWDGADHPARSESAGREVGIGTH